MYRALFREATQSDKETKGFLATSAIFKGLLSAWSFRSRTEILFFQFQWLSVCQNIERYLPAFSTSYEKKKKKSYKLVI